MAIDVSAYDDITPFWFAVDAMGCVAAFDTARCGLVWSEEQLRDYARVDQYVNNVLERRAACRMEDRLSRFREGMYAQFPNPEQMESLGLYALNANFAPYAERGLFAYCAAFAPGTKRSAHYFRVCAPSSPVALDEIPDQGVVTIIRCVQFPAFEFREAAVVDVVSGVRLE